MHQGSVLTPISTLIVDDERLARNRVRRLLSLDPDVHVIGECGTGDEAIAQFQIQKPELVFLDVQMPAVDGFAVVRSVEPEALPVVVLVTAFDEYALRAFEAQAFDYLLKPFDRKRFVEVLRRAKTQVALRRQGAINTRLATLLDELDRKKVEPDRLAIRSGGGVVMVRTSAVDWIEAADNYVCIHCGPERHVVRETMSSLERRLDGKQFMRIHRSAIVNLDRVREIQPWMRGDYQVVLEDGTRLALSRGHRERLKNLLLGRSTAHLREDGR